MEKKQYLDILNKILPYADKEALESIFIILYESVRPKVTDTFAIDLTFRKVV